MSNYTHLNNIAVQGSIESSAQGKLIGSFDTMPAASSLNAGQIVLYTGATGTYVQGKYYVSNGTSWVISAASPSAVTVDSALSDTSTNPVQNKVIKAALDSKVPAVSGKGLSTNDYTTAEKTKLSGIEAGAQVNKVTDVTVNGTTVVGADKVAAIDLSNYATKGDLSAIPKFAISVVTELPTSGISTSTIYLKSNGGSSGNAYDEYIYVNSAWEKIGTTEVDLSGYVPTTRKVNSKALSADITLSASDVGALPAGGTAVKATADASGNNIVNTYATKTEVSAKQDKLTFDSAPTEGSSNPVTSGGVFSAINDISTVQFTLKITYSGAPDVSGISVTATPLIGATATVQGTTNSSGVAYLSVKQNATYKITSSKSGYTFTSEPEITCEDMTTETSISCYVPGTFTITVTDEKASVVGRTVTATASGQTTQTKTVASGQTSVTFSLPAGTWTFTSDYPSGATGATSITQVVENNGVYSGTISVVYNIVFGFQIAIGTSDPSSRVTYPATIFGQTNKAYGKTPASGTGASCMNDWDGAELISGIKRQKGNSSSGWTDIANTAAWQAGSGTTDVMTYVPTWYIKMTNDGTNINVAFSMEKIDDTWMDYAGSVGSNRLGHFRVGCFAGYVSSSNLYSRGSVAPTVSTSITNFISYAKARGTGYDIMTWYQWAYLTALAVLLYKSTDLQTAMAGGYVGGSAVQTESSLTWSNAYGMAGTVGTSSTAQMSFFWIQNLWGNIYQFVGGAKTDSNYRLMTCTGYSSVSDSDFDKTALTASLSSSINGYVSKVTGTTDTGFFPAECSGSGTTYFADYGGVYPSYFPRVGGDYYDGAVAGPFDALFDYSATGTDTYVGSRLSYRL